MYEFLRLFDTPKATITRLQNNGGVNVADMPLLGEVALSHKIYFKPLEAGSDVYDELQKLKSLSSAAKNKIRFFITTDYQNFAAYDTKVDDTLECAFADLAQNYGFFLPLAGLEKSGDFIENPADTKAAEKMGRLFDQIRLNNALEKPEDIHALNVFLTRLLFCFFAEDTKIFPKDSFTKLIESHSLSDGSNIDEILSGLFAVLNMPSESSKRSHLPAHLAAFPYVNGGLFAADEPIPAFTVRTRRLLLECSKLDWSEINPDIFGSMFQSVIDPTQRSRLGQHYTSVPNIMKAIRPLFLDSFQTAFDDIFKRYSSVEGRLKALHSLAMRLGKVKIFDPACGSGNFLIIAYKELRKLEIQIFKMIKDLDSNAMFHSQIRLDQFYGIELDDFAHEIAMLSLWLAEHQMNLLYEHELGNSLPTLPLKSGGNIKAANALREDWESFCPRANRSEDEVYIVGNPPFGGSNSRDKGQNEDMDLVFAGWKKYGVLDYVTCWFWKGAQYIRNSRAKLALVSTNSISQGEQVATLWPSVFALDVRIGFAYQTFPWVNNAKAKAAVHVVIIGLVPEQRSEEETGRLNGDGQDMKLFKLVDQEWRAQNVANISPYLIAGSNLAVAARETPLGKVSPMVYGNKPVEGGNLILSPAEKEALLAAEPQAEKWIKKLLGSEEFINGQERWCIWLRDMDKEELEGLPEKYPEIAKRVERVRSVRLASKKAATVKKAATPHLFDEIRHPKSGNYILVPRVSSERREYVPMDFFNSDVISTDRNQMIPNATLYEFGILNSAMHNDWMRVVTGRLESRFNYSGTIVYNTFPWPEVSTAQQAKITELAEAVLEARDDFPAHTLAQLYDPEKMPDSLRAAHRALDEAVDRLYRPQPFSDGLERVKFLFGLYEKLIGAEKTAAKKH
ncbi:N-6 DNA methylase [Neisseria brasiliensis]|uniref:class I SAM-dependent DNA methyltransferase n=1 Tax=Neisseria brasiliensis TaxID=2666100 RepID=UPI0012A869CB|nr:DNA methyltransferase [Neisseria brasiliensis]QGL24981.1 N-6 DNA methylase [Neisseria brasiliensis]